MIHKQTFESPKLHTPGSHFMWTDPHISTQLLAVHLDPEIDLASRRPSTIQATVEWMLAKCPKGPLRILDLGCGPGLYTEAFARLGHQVTGVDISENSIDYAQKSAEKQNLPITYHNRSYLSLEYLSGQFDLVYMIFTDMGVLSTEERSQVLGAVKEVMAPGASLVFDVLSKEVMDDAITPPTWQYEEGGFWRPESYLLLSEAIPYPKAQCVLNRHIVLQEGHAPASFHFWISFFTKDDLYALMGSHDFKETTIHTLLPHDGPFSGPDVLFVHTIKE